MTFNLSTSQNRFYQIFLDSLSRPNHSAKFWLGWIPKIPRKYTVLRLQPFDNRILGLQKVEILNSDTSVRASHGRRARTSDHQDSSGAELTNILQVSVLRRKIVHMPKRKPVDLDGSTCLNIIF